MIQTIAEQDQAAWAAWHKNPTPANLAIVMKRVEPIINSEVTRWKATGITEANLRSKAKDLAYGAIVSYNPSAGTQLNTHVINHLMKLNRFAIETQNSVRVQEEDVFAYRKLNRNRDELEHTLGREATDEEAMEGMSPGIKLGNLKMHTEHFYSKNVEAGGRAPVREELNHDAVTMQLMHDTLKGPQQTIFKHVYGFNGAPRLKKKAIAVKLGTTPQNVSKHLRKIESKYKLYSNSTSRLMGT